MADKKRELSIKIGQLIMVAIAQEMNPDDVIDVLEEHLSSEKSIQCTRKAAERSY